MDATRAMYAAAVRLATIVSVVAILIAFAADSVGQLSPTRFVTAVAVVGFVSSWMVTGRVERTPQRR